MSAFMDRWLGLLEVGLVVSTAWCLVRAWRRYTPPSRILLIVMLIGAATLVQPFGVRSHPLSRQQFYTPGMHRVDPTGVHALRVAGIPLVSFVLYRRRNPALAENVPSHQLRARSWVGPALLNNASTVTGLCYVAFIPCWTPGERTASGAPNLELWRTADGRYRVRALTYEENPPATAVGPFSDMKPGFFGWELRPAVTSRSGAVAWILLALAAASAALRRRRR